MKNLIFRILYPVLVFIAAVFVLEAVSFHEGGSTTTAMAAPTLPVVSMETEDGVLFNRMTGYTSARSLSTFRPDYTPLSTDRSGSFVVDPKGQTITGITIEVRDSSGEDLIENTDLSDYTTADDGTITASFTLKDLISPDTPYLLVILLDTEDQQDIRYYTRVSYSEDETIAKDSNLLLYESALDFVTKFHTYAVDGSNEAWITTYIEPDAAKDNSDLSFVDITSSYTAVSYGSMNVTQVTAPVFGIRGCTSDTYVLYGTYTLSAPDSNNITCYFDCTETFRIREGFDGFHLISYSRSMEEVFDPQNADYQASSVPLGIADDNMQVEASEDSSCLAFVQAGRLYSVMGSDSTVATIYSYGTGAEADCRIENQNHGIRVLSVDNDGNVDFLVYGYFNSGEHEGQVGVSACTYSGAHHTIEEKVFLNYEGSADVLDKQVENAAYLSDDGSLYLLLDDILYEISLKSSTVKPIEEDLEAGEGIVSAGGRLIAYKEMGEDGNPTGNIILLDLSDLSRQTITAADGEELLPIGFMNEDLIYGAVRKSDLSSDAVGTMYTPMYAIYIVDSDLNTLETYQKDGIYVYEAVLEDNQIQLHRIVKAQDGSFVTTDDDQIVSSGSSGSRSSYLQSASSDLFGTTLTLYVNAFDPDNYRFLSPRFVVTKSADFKVSDLASGVEGEDTAVRFYVYGMEGYLRSYYDASSAVRSAASDMMGVVVDKAGRTVWAATSVDRCQIDGIGDSVDVAADGSTVAACLDAMLRYENVSASVADLVSQGLTTGQIMEQTLSDAEVLDLTGCDMDDVLYYPSVDIPVLAMTGSDSAVLIIGYGPEKVALYDPSTGDSMTLMTREDAKSLFAGYGNRFLSYVR
jgi:hypothetical protein